MTQYNHAFELNTFRANNTFSVFLLSRKISKIAEDVIILTETDYIHFQT